MDSRIILTEADFSANNIGRYVALSELTKKVLAKQTQYDEGSNEAAALNTFLEALIADGYIGGDSPIMKTLFIPALAANHDELLYNIAYLDGNGYPTNEMAAAEVSAESKAYSLLTLNDKIIGLKAGENSIDSYSTQAMFNSHLYAGKQVGDNYDSTSFVAYSPNGNGGTCQILQNLATNNKFNLYNNSVDISRVVTPGILRSASIDVTDWKGFYGISYDATDVEFSGVINGATLGSTTGSESISNWKIQASSENFVIGKYYTVSNRRANVSLVALGDGMTTEQLATLKGYVDTLMIALHVTNS